MLYRLVVLLSGGGFLVTKMTQADALQLTQDFAKWKQGRLPNWPQHPVIAGEDFTVVTDEVNGIYCHEVPEGEEWRG